MAGFKHEHNFRELGGYKTKDGRTVKKGMFYRSGALAFMDERELAAVGRLGLKSIVDLRSTLEHITFPDPPIDGATNYHYTAMNDNDLNEIDYSSRKMILMAMKEPGLNKMESFGKHLYAHVAFDNDAYYKMFQLILRERVPMLFHCTQGKDRTGIAAMLILLLLGVDEETILDDFELTNKYRKSLIKEQMSNFRILSRLSKNIRTFLWVKEGVCRSFAAYALTTIQKRYPSYEDFFRTEYDLSAEDITKIRDLYLE